MAQTEELETAREAHGRRDWPAAWDGFVAARDGGAVLSTDDVYAMADCAWWMGMVEESLAAHEEAYRRYLQGEQPRRAAMTALELGVSLFLRGNTAAGSGWMSRAERLLRDQSECVEQGYHRYLLRVEAALDSVDLTGVAAEAREVHEMGRRLDDPNLAALGLVGEGRMLIRQGRVRDGLALLDEAILPVLAGELDPAWAGNIYCHVVAACHELADLGRAGEWTEALARWCETLPAAAVFGGICRVHRAQLLHTRGAWQQAESEALRVCDELAEIHTGSVAEARYEIAELQRVRGDLEAAEESYRAAHRLGRDPQPGMALLRLAQGRTTDACAAIDAALAGQSAALARVPLLAAQVEIALAAGDLEPAQRASAELGDVAAGYASTGLETMALQARGAVLLTEERTGEGLDALRRACRCWLDLGAPYEAARVQVRLADAYARLGDTDASRRELDEADRVFRRLGAELDARAVAARRGAPDLPGGLSAREVEVLACVATGKTNREIADELVISEKTVARHLSNIFTKIGVSSRTQATVYAFDQQLVGRPG